MWSGDLCRLLHFSALAYLPFEETTSAAKMYHGCLRCDYRVPSISRRLQGYEPMDSLEKGLMRRWRASGGHAPRPAGNSVMAPTVLADRTDRETDNWRYYPQKHRVARRDVATQPSTAKNPPAQSHR